MMRTDYFADLLPDFVTAVTAASARTVTPEKTMRQPEIKGLSDSVTAVTSVTANKQETGKQPVTAQREQAVGIFEYQLTDKRGTWLTMIAPDCDLNKAARTCRLMFGAGRVLAVRTKSGDASSPIGGERD